MCVLVYKTGFSVRKQSEKWMDLETTMTAYKNTIIFKRKGTIRGANGRK